MNLQFDIRVRIGSPAMISKGMLARATVTFKVNDTELVRLDDMLIRQGSDGPWVAYPSRKDSSGKTGDNGKPIYYSYYRPFPSADNKDLRDKLQAAIINKYMDACPSRKTR